MTHCFVLFCFLNQKCQVHQVLSLEWRNCLKDVCLLQVARTKHLSGHSHVGHPALCCLVDACAWEAHDKQGQSQQNIILGVPNCFFMSYSSICKAARSEVFISHQGLYTAPLPFLLILAIFTSCFYLCSWLFSFLCLFHLFVFLLKIPHTHRGTSIHPPQAALTTLMF